MTSPNGQSQDNPRRLFWPILFTATLAVGAVVVLKLSETPAKATESVTGTEARKVEADVKIDLTKAEADAKKTAGEIHEESVQKTEEVKQEFEKLESEASTDIKHEGVVLTDDLYQEVRKLLDYTGDAGSNPPVQELTVPRIESALPDTAKPLATATFPDRPKPLIELGNPFFGNGYIDPGFKVPTGAVWQPQFIVFGDLQTAIQTFNDTSDNRTSEWVNRLDLYSNLAFTPTERIFLNWRPLDRNTTFSGYRFEPGDGEWVNGTFGHIDALFFEGNLLSIFPGLDDYKHGWLDLDFSVGRQSINLQDGLLMLDSTDAVGFTHPSLFTFGSSAATGTAFFSWNHISRGDNEISNSAKLVGGTLRTDYSFSTLELDGIYVNDSDGDGLYFGASAIQRLGPVSSAFRVIQSIALGETSAAVDTGTLLFTQLSMAPPGREDQIYLNGFWGINNFTSAARGPDAGGPLGQTGVLFAAPGIGSYGGSLGSEAQKTVGGALGYQLFFTEAKRQQLVFECGVRHDTSGSGITTEGLGTQYQQAFGQRVVWIVGADVAFPSTGDTGYGARTEIEVKF